MVILAATGLFWASCVGFVQTSARIPADRYFKTHQERWTLSGERDPSIEKATELYRRLSPDELGARGYLNLAGLLLIAYKWDPESNEETQSVNEQELTDALAASLRAEPAHPLTWIYLADAELLIHDDTAKALKYLNQSYRVAPLEPDFFFYRLELALRCRSQWNIELIKHLTRDIASVFEEGRNKNRKRFIALAQNSTQLDAVTEILLRTDPEALQAYRRAVKKKQ